VRYGVTASHLAYEPYDSAPGFFVVTGEGYQTGNIFLNRLAATVVIVARHAEKASAVPNTNLAPDPDDLGVGVGRATALAEITGDAGVVAVFTTAYCRTAQTAQPTASDLGLTLQVLSTSDPNAGLDDCDPSITVSTAAHPASLGNPSVMASHILAEHRGEVVLVVGHSNTVAQIITALGAPSPCPAFLPGAPSNCLIPENEFNHLFVVTVPHDDSTPSLTHELYGAP
jgi:broad specificity phosphatase PhoE